MTTREQIEGEIAEVDATIKLCATTWLELDKRKTKRRNRGGLYALLAIIALAFLADQAPPSIVQGFALGAVVVLAGVFYDHLGGEIGREMDKQHAIQLEANYRREILLLKLAHMERQASQ